MVLLFIFFTLAVQMKAIAQSKSTGAIKGTILDSSIGQPMEAATISVYLVADSSLINYAISDKKGQFQIKALPPGEKLKVIISYHGFESLTKYLLLEAIDPLYDLKEIRLSKRYTTLEEIIVTAEVPPVIYKKDTIEFNAGSFRTKPNATVEDLLKRLPGVEVDRDGNITVNGRKVAKVTVNGKLFFGGDPLMATRNLPKDIVDKIQVSINRSLEAQFNGTTTGNEDLAINIDLDDDKSKGLFGRATAGFGSRDRYELGANLNYFGGKHQYSLVLSHNNTNHMNYGESSRGRNSRGGNGLTRNTSGGINFSTQASNKISVNGSYSYGESSSIITSRRKRENTLPDTSFFYFSTSDQQFRSRNNRLSMDLNYAPDSLTSLNFNVAGNMNTGSGINFTDAYSQSIAGQKLNGSNTILNNDSRGSDVNVNMYLSRQFKQPGSGITLTFASGESQNRGLMLNQGVNSFVDQTGSLKDDILDQKTNDNSSSNYLNLGIGWSQPVTKKLNFVLSAFYSKTTSGSDRNTFNRNGAGDAYDQKDTSLSNTFRNNSETITPSLIFNYTDEKFGMTLSNGLNILNQENRSVSGNTSTRQQYINYFPNANFRYQLGKMSSVNVSYSGQNQPPSIDQLQPVVNNQNPLYIRLGNPMLKPSFNHSFGMNMYANNYSRQISVNTGLQYGIYRNAVVDEIYFDSIGRQISRPVNTNGNYNASLYLNYQKTYKASKWKFSLGGNTSLHQNSNVLLTNKIRGRAKSFGITQGASVETDLEDVFNTRFNYTIGYNNAGYTNSSVDQSPDNLRQSFSIDVLVNITQRLIIESDIVVDNNSRISPGFRKTNTYWMAAANLILFKKEQGNLRFTIYDILRQNASIYRMVSQTYVEDSQMNVLQQYFLVSFTYNLKQFGK